MDRGANALEMIEGKAFPLKHGYYGVKLRSKLDIDNKVTIQQSIDEERQWFATNPDYSRVAQKMGIPNLRKVLNSILIEHIK